jgi:hypothetical protein
MKLLNSIPIVLMLLLSVACSKEVNKQEDDSYVAPTSYGTVSDKISYPDFRNLDFCEKLKLDNWIVDSSQEVLLISLHSNWDPSIWQSNSVITPREGITTNPFKDSISFTDSLKIYVSYPSYPLSFSLSKNMECENLAQSDFVFLCDDPSAQVCSKIKILELQDTLMTAVYVSNLYLYTKGTDGPFNYGFIDTLYLSMDTKKLNLSPQTLP